MGIQKTTSFLLRISRTEMQDRHTPASSQVVLR